MASPGYQQTIRSLTDKFPTEWAMCREEEPRIQQTESQPEKKGHRSLQELKDELVRGVQSSLDLLAVSRTANPEDSIGALTELTARNLDLLMNRLRALENVLHGIREGKDGCATCGGGISLDWLVEFGCPSCCAACDPRAPAKR